MLTRTCVQQAITPLHADVILSTIEVRRALDWFPGRADQLAARGTAVLLFAASNVEPAPF